ncbi:MAG: hypothetical protein ACYDCH_02625 [Gaiellaceae bacterium]
MATTTLLDAAFGRLLTLLHNAPATPAPKGDSAPGTAPAGVDPNADATALTASFTELRTDVQRWGAGVGAVVTAVLTGLGWTQLDKLFPFPPNVDWISWTAGACAVAAVGGSVFIFMRLYRAQRRILIGSDYPPPRRRGISWFERKNVESILDEQARTERAVHMQDVDARALRLERIAAELELTKNELAPAARSEAKRLDEYLTLALKRAALAVLENRARKAISGVLTWVGVLTTAFGIAGLFALANWSQGARDSARKPSSTAAALACIKEVGGAAVNPTVRAELSAYCVKLIAP